MPPKKSALDLIFQHIQKARKSSKRGKSRYRILIFAHVGFTLFLILLLEGSHQAYIDKANVSWWLWLLLMGVLQGGPLRQGLPIHLFVIYPHIVRVSIGSQVCSSLLFQTPPYPDVIKCPDIAEPERPSVSQIIIHLCPELLFWSLGTLIMNFIFFKLYKKIPDKDVASNEDKIKAVIKGRLYYKKIEAVAKASKLYFTLSPYNLVLQDADVSAAIAGLHRFPAKKFIKDSLLYPILMMNLILTPGFISLICIVIHRIVNPGSAVQNLLSIEASDEPDASDSGFSLNALKSLKDVLFFAVASVWFWRFVRQNSADDD